MGDNLGLMKKSAYFADNSEDINQKTYNFRTEIRYGDYELWENGSYGILLIFQ